MKNLIGIVAMMLCLSVDLLAQGVGQNPTNRNSTNELLSQEPGRFSFTVVVVAACIIIVCVILWIRRRFFYEAAQRVNAHKGIIDTLENHVCPNAHVSGIQATDRKIRLLKVQLKDEERARRAGRPMMTDAEWTALQNASNSRIANLRALLAWHYEHGSGPRAFNLGYIKVKPEAKLFQDFASSVELPAETYSFPSGESYTRRELWEALDSRAVGSITFHRGGSQRLDSSEKQRILDEMRHMDLEDVIRKPFEEEWFKSFFPYDTTSFQEFMLNAIACHVLLLSECMGAERKRRASAGLPVSFVDRADQVAQQRSVLEEITKWLEGQMGTIASNRERWRKYADLGHLLAHLEVASQWAQKGYSFGDVWLDMSDHRKLAFKWGCALFFKAFSRKGEFQVALLFSRLALPVTIYDGISWMQGSKSGIETAQGTFMVE